MEMEHIPVIEPLGLRGEIHCTALEVPDELDDLQLLKDEVFKLDDTLRNMRDSEEGYHIKQKCRLEELKAYVQLSQEDYQKLVHEEEIRHKGEVFRIHQGVMRVIKAGGVPGTKVLDRQGGQNLLVRGFYQEIFARMMGAITPPTAAQTLFIEQLAVGTNNDATSFTQTTLNNEIYRDVPDDILDDGVKTLYASLYLKKSEANPNFTTVTSSTTTVITVVSATGIILGARLRVETTLNTYNCTVLNVSGLNITVGNITGGVLLDAGAFLVSDTPQSGDDVYVLHSEAGFFLGENATSTPNTGNMGNRKPIEVHKKLIISLIYDFILAGASVEI